MKFIFSPTEYNPFHRGHEYHLRCSRREAADADAFIAIMSGNFTQRGLPAIADKYARAEAAVSCGVDCVIELPFPFATAAAPVFAHNALRIMNSICSKGDYISFGSECGDLSALNGAVDTLTNEPPEFRQALQNSLGEGQSYPVALSAALGSTLDSNDILAVEYLKALRTTNSPLRPIVIKRSGSSHAVSASKIRKAISEGSDIQEFLPENSRKLLESRLQEGLTPDEDMLGSLLLFLLRTTAADKLKSIYDISEGLENRLIETARNATDYSALIEAVSTKRYSASRINRILLNILVGLTEEKMRQHLAAPPYIKVLALKNSRKDILTELAKRSAIVTRSDDYFTLSDGQKNLYMLEKTASDIFALLYKNKKGRYCPSNKLILVEST